MTTGTLIVHPAPVEEVPATDFTVTVNGQPVFTHQARFTGKGWELGPPRLVDVDCRHCPEFRVRVMRSPNGRIWAAWMHDDRHNKLWLRGRYSDDDDQSWRDPDSNAMLVLDGDGSQGPQKYGITLWPTSQNVKGGPASQPDGQHLNGRIDDFYSQGCFELTRFGDQVACLYTRTWHPTSCWTCFDGDAGGRRG